MRSTSNLIVTVFLGVVLLSPGTRAYAAEFYAFLVGVKQYDKTQFNPLQFCENDVTELAAQLQKVGFKKDNIVLMTQTVGATSTDFLPVKANISKQFGLILKELQPDDTLLVVFSGHGIQFKGEDIQYFCPQDAKVADKKTLISVNQMYTAMSTMCKARNKLLVVDACRNDPVTGLAKSAKGIELDPIGVKRTEPPKGLAAIYSCRENEMSWEHPDLKHGVFLHHVIQAFQGVGDLDKDGDLTLSELELYAVKNTQRFVRKEFKTSQTPERLGQVEGLMTLGKINSSGQSSDEPIVRDSNSGQAESYFEDFRQTPEQSLPDGWFSPDRYSLAVRQGDGRPYLRYYSAGSANWGINNATGMARMPPVALQGDFFIEMAVLSNTVWYYGPERKIREIILELKNAEDEKLTFRAFEEGAGFITILPGSQESSLFSLAGRAPYRFRLERKDGKYRFLINSKLLLEHDAKDHRNFDVCELSLSPEIFVGGVKIGPLTADTAKPDAKPPTDRKPPRK
jgi:hypothetical protein